MPNEQAATRPVSQFEALRVPTHIGVIMDGNGRWAKQRGRPRTEGHRQGIIALKRLVRLCNKYGVPYVTVFSFSSENWTRPKTEIEFIFNLLHKFVEADLNELHQNNVRVRVLGERNGLDVALQRTIAKVEATTARNSGLKLNVAFNYGGKSEIVEATRSIAADVKAGRLDLSEVTEELIEQRLYTAGMPAPDLLIRTGGEQRISNFLIWQNAYAELVFLDTWWPDFGEEDFVEALQIFSERERRFGGLSEASA